MLHDDEIDSRTREFCSFVSVDSTIYCEVNATNAMSSKNRMMLLIEYNLGNNEVTQWNKLIKAQILYKLIYIDFTLHYISHNIVEAS